MIAWLRPTLRALIALPIVMWNFLTSPRKTVRIMRLAMKELETIEAQDVMRPPLGYWDNIERTQRLTRLAVWRKRSEFDGKP